MAENKGLVDEKENAESIILEIQKRVAEAFEIFDHENNKTVDVREVGTIIRSLSCCPSENDLRELFTELEEEEFPGFIRFDKFLPLMTQVLLERRYRPASEELLLKAFKVLDTEDKGFLMSDRLQEIMMNEGEPFSAEEMEEMLSTAINPETNSVAYKDFIPLMIIEES